jgi:2,3-bisphosphoglycerate-independent phosphoglycerate mutase
MKLAPHASLVRRPGPVVLCIMDGIGIGRGEDDDALRSARTPNLDRLMRSCPYTTLLAHGKAVGMPSDDDLGNSEVGHNAMGAGRVFDQGAKLVDRAIESGSAWASDVWKQLCAGRTLHLMGLVSDGNVHSHIAHVEALIERAATDGVTRLRLHVLTDGRDVPARSALRWVEPLEARLREHTNDGLDYAIGSGGGRMRITMDRYEADWSMVARGWACHVHALGPKFASASAAIRTWYDEDRAVDDQRLPEFVVEGHDGIHDGDSVLFFNFRGDRAIEISRAFEDDDLGAFERGARPRVFYAGMMQYDGDLMLPKHYLVTPPDIDETVGEHLVDNGLRTFACSETQKYGHVTYFFNGNKSGYIDDKLERYVQIASDNVSFDERPWMKAAEISDACVEAIGSQSFDLVRLNYPNGDMVGHTGDLEATRIAVEVVDRQIARLEAAVARSGGVLLITADHGNADEMYLRHKDGSVAHDDGGAPLPRTAHTTHRVPFIVVDPAGKLALADTALAASKGAGIAHIGATLIELCGLSAPKGYLPGLVGLR